MELGKLALRATIGTFFIGHGMQKLNGSFGGHGLDGTGQFFENLGLRPGRRHALLAGVAEAGGGALLLAGLATPLAVAALSGVMVMAIRTVHLKNGPWAASGGYEYNVVLLAALFSIAESGPGKLSLDALRGKERHGTAWAVLAVGGGALGAAAALVDSRRRAEQAGLAETGDPGVTDAAAPSAATTSSAM
jgi:putative oxidoreductase